MYDQGLRHGYIGAWSECAHVTNDCRYPGVAIEAMEMVLKLANIEYELALVTVAEFVITLEELVATGWGDLLRNRPTSQGCNCHLIQSPSVRLFAMVSNSRTWTACGTRAGSWSGYLGAVHSGYVDTIASNFWPNSERSQVSRCAFALPIMLGIPLLGTIHSGRHLCQCARACGTSGCGTIVLVQSYRVGDASVASDACVCPRTR